MTDISVVIVNWNTRDILLQCIRSIVATVRRHTVEVVVVDNASSDGSADAVAGEFPQVKLIRNQKNLGFARANNAGIEVASGRYVCLVNSDVEVLEQSLDTMCDYLDQQPKVGLMGPQVLNSDLSLQPSCGELPSLRNVFMQAFMLDKLFPRVHFCRNRFMNHFDHRTLRDVEALSGCFLMARRQALEQVGLLDARFFIYKEDVDWCKRFADAGWLVRFYPEARAIHYGGKSSSAAPARFLIEMERANLQYWRKHHGWAFEKIVAIISAVHYGLRISVLALVYLLRLGNRAATKHKILNYAGCLSWLGGFSQKSSIRTI